MEKEKEKELLNEEEKKEVTLEEKLVLLENELNDYKKAYALKLAEFQNFSKRKEKELKEYKEFASKDIILKVLENLDNLQRAMEVSKESKNYDALVQGLEMSVNNLLENLKAEEVFEIEALGMKYNINEHHAINIINDPSKENDTVVMVFQKGYKLKGKVIRPAMVIVNKITENLEEEK